MIKHFISIIIFCIALICSNSELLASDRDNWQKPEQIMDSVGVVEGMVIGEMGAGRGYFTFKLAKRVGDSGKVFANDIDKSVLEKINEKCEDNNIFNITTILGEDDNPLFPDSTLDLVAIMIAFHDFENPVTILKNLREDLKPQAKVVIIERDPDKWERGRGHFMPESEIIELIEKANYNVIHVYRFLPRDNIYVCKPR